MEYIGADYFSRHKKFRTDRKKLAAVFLAFAIIVAIVVFWWLKLVGITVTGEAFCGLYEHTHTDDCFVIETVCGYKEINSEATEEMLTVSEITEATAEHIHTDDCFNKTLICEKNEHIHTADCFPDKSADVETVSDWLETLENTEITNNIPENLVAVALSQQGYEESQNNFEYDSDGNKNGYTRYGEWYGNPYGKWNVMFVSFCLHYSNVNNVDELKSAGAEAMRLSWQNRNIYSSAEGYEPERGDVVFFDENGDNIADTTAIVLSVNADSLLVIEGDSENRVETKLVDLSDSILGYGMTGELSFAKDTEYGNSESETQAAPEGTTTVEDMPVMLLNTDMPEENIIYINDLTSVVKSVTFMTMEGDVIDNNSTVYLGQTYIVSMRFAEVNTGEQWIQFRHDEDHHLHYQIPENLHCGSFNGEWHPITARTENGTIENVGRYTVREDGLLIVVFDDDPETGECFGAKYSNVDFTIDFNATVGTSQSGTSTDVVFTDEIKVNLNIDSTAEMKVNKTHGTYDPDTHTVDYTIKIEATKAVIKDLVVKDDIWENHYALRDTIVVTDLNGNVLDPQPTISDNPSNGAEEGFQLSGFPDFAIGEGFLIKYKSAIKDEMLGDEKVSMWNGVYLTGKDANGKNVPAEAQDWLSVELEKMSKDGKQSAVQDASGNDVPVIEWNVEIKKDNHNLQGTVVIDTLGDGLSYYTGKDIRVIRYDEWGYKLPDVYISWQDVTINGNSMEFSLPDGYAFEIVYYTEYEELAEGEKKHYTNSVSAVINGKQETAGGDADVIGFIPHIVKSASGNDGKYVYFTIEADVPAVIKDWGNFHLTDLAAFWGYENPEGYLYVQNVPQDMQITATTKTGQVVTFTPYVPGGPTENTYILLTPALGDQHHSFNVFFNTSTADYAESKWILSEDSVLRITYKIPFDAKTGVEWEGELTGSKTLVDVLLEEKKLANEAYLNYTDVIRDAAVASYSYSPKITKKSVVNDDGTIDYTVVFNNTIPGTGGNGGYLVSANSIIFHDTFDEKLEYVKGSLMVTCYNPWDNAVWYNKYKYDGAVTGNSINIPANQFMLYQTNNELPSGTINWISPYTNYQYYCNALGAGGKHVFTYKLKLKDEYLNSTEDNRYILDNTAELTWDGDNTSGPASDTVEIRTGLLDKHVVQENNNLFFDIHINRNALDILKGASTLTIEDTMTENLSVYWNSIKLLYEDKTIGQWIDFDSNESTYSYTVTYDQISNKLTFVLPDELHIRIDYTTLITKSGLVSVNNAVKIDGKAQVTDFIDATFKVDDHSGDASGSMHDITLLKQDGDTDERLPNVTFHLYGLMGDSSAVIPDGVAASILSDKGKTLKYIGTYTTGADGTVVIKTQYLTMGGPYGLVEVAPPEGYAPLKKPVYFYFYEPDPDGMIQTVTTIIAVENYTYGFVFPETGGNGILPTAIIGTSLMLFPILYSIIRRKRERRLY